ncbi:DUF4373 domain-containing protein [Paenibacillus melissococcoides]|uniref:DUF4373 domain-containing protein n=2 Tax=Paenibacillus TaxID=44249 RepID=UPI0038B40E83
MKEAYYFSHDSNARQDPKILAMRSVYSSEGYGWYWIIIEMLREQADYRIELTKYVWNALAMQMQCDSTTAKNFVDECINEFHLLHSDGQFFWSESLIRRMGAKEEKSEKAKKAAQARWAKTASNQGPMQSQCERNADAMQVSEGSNAIKERKEEERKVKKKKGEEKKEEHAASPPSSPPSSPSLFEEEQLVSDYYRDIIAELHKVKGYPADLQKDVEFIQALEEGYPTVELLAEARKWRIYKLEKPLEAKSNARSQFRTWVSKAAQWQKERDQKREEQEADYTPPYWQKWQPDEEGQ